MVYWLFLCKGERCISLHLPVSRIKTTKMNFTNFVERQTIVVSFLSCNALQAQLFELRSKRPQDIY